MCNFYLKDRKKDTGILGLQPVSLLIRGSEFSGGLNMSNMMQMWLDDADGDWRTWLEGTSGGLVRLCC